MSHPVEAFFNALSKYSWRTLFGVFIASGTVLFFPSPLKVEVWASSYHAYIVAAFILSGAVLATHLATWFVAAAQKRGAKRVDLRMVSGSPLYSTWSISVQPGRQKPMMILLSQMNFAHYEDFSVILKDAYLKGTKSVMPTAEIVVEGSGDDRTSLCIGVSPIKPKPGKAITGRLVFVDQFNDKHRSESITFSPNTLPSDAIAKMLVARPTCAFCSQPVTLETQAKEAQVTAHTKCIWS